MKELSSWISACRPSILALFLSSLSFVCSRMRNVLSTSCLSFSIVWESLSDSFKADSTFIACSIISLLSSLHYFSSYFSFVCEFFKALYNFSYSERNLSKAGSYSMLSNTYKTLNIKEMYIRYLVNISLQLFHSLLIDGNVINILNLFFLVEMNIA